MKKLLCVLGALALAACNMQPPATPSAIPGASTVCAAVSIEKLDVALHAYDAALDAINLLIDAKVLVPGSSRAKAVADANDRVLAAFKAADSARAACDATSYSAALSSITAGIAQVRAAIHGG